MGEGVNEATLVRWLKQAGDMISKDEPLLEVSTDKVDTEIPAPTQGRLVEIKAQEGDTILVDQVIAILEEGNGATATISTPSKPKKPQNPKAENNKVHNIADNPEMSKPTGMMKSALSGSDVKSSPLVRKIAQENHIDLNQVEGTGLNGRITKKDILLYLEQDLRDETPVKTKAPQPNTSGQSIVPVETKHLNLETIEGKECLEGVVVDRQKMTRMRQLIAEHMVESVRTSPHVTTTFEVDLHKVVKIRETNKDEFFEKEDFKLTYTPFFIHATVQAIKEFPEVNSSVDGFDILYKKDINVGCAVAIDNGLIVPVIKNAGELSLLGIARRLNDLVTRARNKQLTPEDVRGGTFTITNPGGFGSITSNPIINQPQVAIMGIGAIVKRPAVVDDMIGIRPQMMISLTFDHRVVDGEGGAKFLAHIKNTLENYSDLPF